MSTPTPPTPSKALSVFLGILAAFASFALATILIQWFFGGKSDEAHHQEHVAIKNEVIKAQQDLLEKGGLTGNPLPVYDKVLAVLKTRSVSTTQIVVPNTPTAIAASQAAPAEEAPKPAEPAKTETAPAPVTPPAPVESKPAPAPAPAAESKPAPAPAPPAPAPTSPPAPAPANPPAAPAPAPVTPPPSQPAAPAPAPAPEAQPAPAPAPTTPSA